MVSRQFFSFAVRIDFSTYKMRDGDTTEKQKEKEKKKETKNT
jgi:hypothetical protein